MKRFILEIFTLPFCHRLATFSFLNTRRSCTNNKSTSMPFTLQRRSQQVTAPGRNLPLSIVFGVLTTQLPKHCAKYSRLLRQNSCICFEYFQPQKCVCRRHVYIRVFLDNVDIINVNCTGDICYPIVAFCCRWRARLMLQMAANRLTNQDERSGNFVVDQTLRNFCSIKRSASPSISKGTEIYKEERIRFPT